MFLATLNLWIELTLYSHAVMCTYSHAFEEFSCVSLRCGHFEDMRIFLKQKMALSHHLPTTELPDPMKSISFSSFRLLIGKEKNNPLCL